MVRNERGLLSLPLSMLFLALAVGAFGILGVLRSWRGKVEIQLEIDRCVGVASQGLRDSLHRLGELNRGMIATRAGLATIGAVPQLRVPLQATLEGEMIAQELIRGKWDFQMTAWLTERGCRPGGGDVPKPLPGLRLRRPPPDSLGSKPLEWEPEASREYTIWLSHPPRYSAATVSPDDNESEEDHVDDDSESQTLAGTAGVPNVPSSWKAVWSSPERLANFPEFSKWIFSH